MQYLHEARVYVVQYHALAVGNDARHVVSELDCLGDQCIRVLKLYTSEWKSRIWRTPVLLSQLALTVPPAILSHTGAQASIWLRAISSSLAALA